MNARHAAPDTRNLALDERIAGAPIAWGVTDEPGRGWPYDPESVFGQMNDVGLAATELGPDGFLPDDPAAKAEILSRHDLQAVGVSVPVVLHLGDHDPLPDLERVMAGLSAVGGTIVVLTAATEGAPADERQELDEQGWATLLANLDRLADAAREQGLTAALHPRVGSSVATGDDIERVLADSRIGLCLDTGHVILGGGDPLALARRHPGRIAHVHLKDVRLELARKVQTAELSYAAAVGQGLYPPLGEGDLDTDAMVTVLEDLGYSGWYVLDQEAILDEAQAGDGPLDAVLTSFHHLLGIAAQRSGVGI